jgi:hypothetical protein
MKTRRLVAAVILLVSLIACSISATADEKLGSLQTSLGNPTVGGYVHSSGTGELPPPASSGRGGWWWNFMLLFGFHRR